ncbi:MAG: LysM peptidoglycan-binding domain-containing protein [Proteobacteria bacterium]|nr:LysM peptidoglycan-binding domain-containing protein [Pseudomonadota bacterium]
MPHKHTVRQGECLHSISSTYGFTWEKIWRDSQNSDLRAKRRDPQVLMPGDVVAIPDRETKNESASSEQRHRFRRKAVPAKIRVQVKRDNEPRANVPYRIDIDGKLVSGMTNGDGVVEVTIPPDASAG